MKSFLKEIFKNIVTFAFVTAIFAGLTYGNDLWVLLIAAIMFTIINFYLKPIIKIFMLPINVLTLGMFRWVTGVICLLILTILIPEIKIQSFFYTGLNYGGFSLPSFYFSTLLSLIFASFLISITAGFIDWLLKK